MSFITPWQYVVDYVKYKKTWTAADYINAEDWNRIESNILEVHDYLQSIQYAMQPLSDNNYSLSFDGVDDYVNLGSPAALNITGDMTLEMWVYLTAYEEIFMTWANPGYVNFPFHWLCLAATGGRVRINLNSAGTFDSASPVPLNSWNHVAVTISGTTVTFYLNGNPDGVYTTTGARTTGNAYLTISDSAPSSTRVFKGQIDEPRIWNVARTQAQLVANMKTNLVGTETGLVGYWKCADGQGTTLTATTGVNGVLTNGTTWSTNKPYSGSWLNRTAESIDFLSSINRIEQNLDNIRANFLTPAGYLPAETWTVGKFFDYTDANRLEANTELLMNFGKLAFDNFRYCGTQTCGNDWGLIY